MKKFYKACAVILIGSLFGSLVLSNDVYAQAQSEALVENENDIYVQGKCETVNIEGINYTFEYSYKNGNRVVHISNDKDGRIDKVYYNESEKKVYYNGKAVMQLIESNKNISIGLYGGWTTVGTDSHYISWGEAVGTAVLASMISIAVGHGVGASAVIAAMGTGALSTLASCAGGGTVYIQEQTLKVPLEPPRRRYLWTFTASTGDSYGPFILNDF